MNDRDAVIRKLQELGLSEDLAEHVYDRQIEPHLFADRMRALGHDGEVATVSLAGDAKGHKVTCAGCGRTARLSFQPPDGAKPLCPDCQAATGK